MLLPSENGEGLSGGVQGGVWGDVSRKLLLQADLAPGVRPRGPRQNQTERKKTRLKASCPLRTDGQAVSAPPGREGAGSKTGQAVKPHLEAFLPFPDESSLVRILPLQAGFIPSETLKGYFLLVEVQTCTSKDGV